MFDDDDDDDGYGNRCPDSDNVFNVDPMSEMIHVWLAQEMNILHVLSSVVTRQTRD